MSFNAIRLSFLLINLLVSLWLGEAFAEEAKKLPLIINGDNVEYSADSRSVSATGKVEVLFKGAKLTCNKLTVNMDTKEAVAEGNARLDDEKGAIEGEKLIYNFVDKTGTIVNAKFRVNPYFGRAKKLEKVSDDQYDYKGGYFTTCSMDRPHYRIASKNITIYPYDKIQSESSTLYLGTVPLVYLPRFNYSMKEPLMHTQVVPGTRKDWGPYILDSWRYNLTENLNSNFYLDYRSKLGLAEGFNLNYQNPVNKGDFKFYYTNEKPGNIPAGQPSVYQRYLIRFRDKWDIDERTNFTTEFYKITDERIKFDPTQNFLRDYFFREYERDTQPLSYALFHHSFNYSSLDVNFQPRVNHWFDQVSQAPEVNYNMPSLQLGNTPFYFENSTQLANLDKKDITAPVTSSDVRVTRLDSVNKISLPMKVSIFQFQPFVQNEETFYNTGANGQSDPIRSIFYGGADVSTKFYRLFNVKSNFLGLNINGLRHIITPSVGYLYTHTPTIPASNLRQIDSVDSITRGNTATLTLENKLQTKRSGSTVDFLDFWMTTNYVLDPKSGPGNNSILFNTGNKLKTDISDILFQLQVIPYSWMHMESQATFLHGNHDDINYDKFSLANYDLYFDIDKNRSFSIGQRYERKGKNEITSGFQWWISPKWKFSIYERYNFKECTSLSRGSQEQELTITRDLHCWTMDISLDTRKGQGTGIYFTFRLKAFPNDQFNFHNTVSTRKSGSQ